MYIYVQTKEMGLMWKHKTIPEVHIFELSLLLYFSIWLNYELYVVLCPKFFTYRNIRRIERTGHVIRIDDSPFYKKVRVEEKTKISVVKYKLTQEKNLGLRISWNIAVIDILQTYINRIRIYEKQKKENVTHRSESEPTISIFLSMIYRINPGKLTNDKWLNLISLTMQITEVCKRLTSTTVVEL